MNGLDQYRERVATERREFERELEAAGAIAYVVTESSVRVWFEPMDDGCAAELKVDMFFYPEGPFFQVNDYHSTSLETP